MLDLTEDSSLFDNLSTVTYTDPSGTVYTVDNVKVYPAANISAELSDTNVRSVSSKFCMWSNSISVPPQVNGRLVIVSGPTNLGDIFNRSFRILAIEEATLQSRWIITAIIDAGGTL